MKKFVIVGAGTAGLLASLYVKNRFPSFEVTVVRSEEIGIIGVGEGTTQHFLRFLREVNIDPIKIIKGSRGTVKTSIKFTNWSGDNSSYHHLLGNIDVTELSLAKFIHDRIDLDKDVFHADLNEAGEFNLRAPMAMHFDSSKMAYILEKIAIDRGIEFINAEARDFNTDDRGFITQIVLDDGRKVSSDFVFDCTGFHRKIIGKFYNQKWISFSDFLPAKKALAFWLQKEIPLKPYTESIALSSGWSWKIPTQDRIGSGYVFDSNYISDEEAIKEARDFYGVDIEVRKSIPFDPGIHNKIWVKNCVAIGLAGSFLEPLEATSLWHTIAQIKTLFENVGIFSNLFIDESKKREDYNSIVFDAVKSSAEFIYLHYYSTRNDTPFWKEFKKVNPIPDEMKDIISSIESGDFFHIDFTRTGNIQFTGNYKFGPKSMVLVAKGNGILKKVNLPDYMKGLEMNLGNKLGSEFINHEEFLNSIRL